jgi:hypothetical protein
MEGYVRHKLHIWFEEEHQQRKLKQCFGLFNKAVSSHVTEINKKRNYIIIDGKFRRMFAIQNE